MLRRQKAQASAIEILKSTEQKLSAECNNHIRTLNSITTAVPNDNWKADFLDEALSIVKLNRKKLTLRKKLRGIKQTDTQKLKYQISSLMVCDCWRYLISNPSIHEMLHLVTGTITVDGTKVLSRIEKVTFEKQNAAYVSANNLDTHKKILSLDEEYGHQVLGMFHSHMSKGMGATFPSSIDTNFMERMQKLGCDCLGGIFSLDGFVRFFAIKDFEIDVYGKGVECIHDEPCEKVFRITAKAAATYKVSAG